MKDLEYVLTLSNTVLRLRAQLKMKEAELQQWIDAPMPQMPASPFKGVAEGAEAIVSKAPLVLTQEEDDDDSCDHHM